MLKETELAWLAGILDGEGTVLISRQTVSSGNKGKSYNIPRPHVTVTNTSPHIINECARLFDALEVKFVIGTNNAKHMHKSLGSQFNRKLCIRLTVMNYASLVRLLSVVTPYLVAKKGEGELILQFVLLAKRRGSWRSQEDRDTMESLYGKVQELHSTRPNFSVTTVRRASPRVLERMIQSELVGDNEKSAEMTGSTDKLQ